MGDIFVAVDRCGCSVGAQCEDSGRASLRRFYIESVGLEIRRVPASEFKLLDICDHQLSPAQPTLFSLRKEHFRG